MKNVIKFFLPVLFLMFLIGNTYSQTVATSTAATKTATVEQRTTNALIEMNKIITLTAEQTQKVTTILTQFFTQKDLDIQKYKDQDEQLGLATKARKEIFVEDMKAVLTGDQMDLLLKQWGNLSPKNNRTETQTTE
jgi:hypothetical protein